MKIKPLRFISGLLFATITGFIIYAAFIFPIINKTEIALERLSLASLIFFPFSIAFALGIFLPPEDDERLRNKYSFNINPLSGLFWMKGPNTQLHSHLDDRMAARRARVAAARKKSEQENGR